MVLVQTPACRQVGEVDYSSLSFCLNHQVLDGPWRGCTLRGINLGPLVGYRLCVLVSMDLLASYGDPEHVLVPLQGLRDGYGGPFSHRGLGKVLYIVLVSIDC